jgi:hypothetical protein
MVHYMIIHTSFPKITQSVSVSIKETIVNSVTKDVKTSNVLDCTDKLYDFKALINLGYNNFIDPPPWITMLVRAINYMEPKN